METSSIPTQSQPFSLPPYHERLQSEAEELAARFADRHRDVRLYPFEHGELYPELWREISERGWPGLLVPAEHGGVEGGLLAYVVVMEGAGRFEPHPLDAGAQRLDRPRHRPGRGRSRSQTLAGADRLRRRVPRSGG